MKYEMFTKRKVFLFGGQLHIVCILGPYLTSGTWHYWVTQNCTQGFVGPCSSFSLILTHGDMYLTSLQIWVNPEQAQEMLCYVRRYVVGWKWKALTGAIQR